MDCLYNYIHTLYRHIHSTLLYSTNGRLKTTFFGVEWNGMSGMSGLGRCTRDRERKGNERKRKEGKGMGGYKYEYEYMTAPTQIIVVF